MERLIDISLPVGAAMLTWPGDPAVSVEPRTRIARGDAANVSEIRMGTHTGTHVDPPSHFIDGAGGVDGIPIEVLMGDAVVADARGRMGALGPDELESLAIPPGTERVLLKTNNSSLWTQAAVRFPERYVCLSPDGAAWVVARGIKLIGTDFLSIEAQGAAGHPVHVTLLRAGVVIVERLNLGSVEPGAYGFACLPLRIVDGDGGPARAILIRS